MSQILIIARNHAGVNIDDCFYIIFPPLTWNKAWQYPHLLLPPGDITPYVMAKKCRHRQQSLLYALTRTQNHDKDKRRHWENGY